MSEIPRLEAYHFYEQDWDSYDQLVEAFEWEVPEQFNIVEYVCDRWAESEKNRVALYVEEPDGRDTAYTFRQLRNEANRLANYLTQQGIEPGDRIAIHGPQKFEVLIATFAGWKCGAVTVPISVLLGPDGLRYRLADADIDAVVADADGIEPFRDIKTDLDSLQTTLTIDVAETKADEVPFWTALDRQSRQYDTVETDAEDNAQIIYTSGTTGDPKGTIHAHRHFLGLLPSSVFSHRNMAVRADDVGRMAAEWAWAGTINTFIIPNLYYGTPVVAYPSSEFEPETEFELIEKFGVTIVAGPPTVCRMMMQVDDVTERYDVSSLRLLGMGGEAVGERLLDWVNETFDAPTAHAAYGQTESPFCLSLCQSLGIDLKPGDNYLGVPCPGYEVRLVDPESKEPAVDRGDVGELAIKHEGNPSIFKAYRNEPAKTAQKFHNGWMLTEDLARKDEDGYYVFASRNDDVIVTSGYRVGPEEIEACLETHGAVVHAGVIGVPHEERGEVPKAFVQLAESHSPSATLREELQTYVKDRLAKYEYPRELEFIETVPTTTTGKIRRVALRDREGLT